MEVSVNKFLQRKCDKDAQLLMVLVIVVSKLLDLYLRAAKVARTVQ